MGRREREGGGKKSFLRSAELLILEIVRNNVENVATFSKPFLSLSLCFFSFSPSFLKKRMRNWKISGSFQRKTDLYSGALEHTSGRSQECGNSFHFRISEGKVEVGFQRDRL